MTGELVTGGGRGLGGYNGVWDIGGWGGAVTEKERKNQCTVDGWSEFMG